MKGGGRPHAAHVASRADRIALKHVPTYAHRSEEARSIITRRRPEYKTVVSAPSFAEAHGLPNVATSITSALARPSDVSKRNFTPAEPTRSRPWCARPMHPAHTPASPQDLLELLAPPRRVRVVGARVARPSSEEAADLLDGDMLTEEARGLLARSLTNCWQRFSHF